MTHTRRRKRRTDGTVTTIIEPIKYSLGRYSELTVQDTAEPCEQRIWNKEGENQEMECKKRRIEGTAEKKDKGDNKRNGESRRTRNDKKRKNYGVVSTQR